jgi:Tol biopolymer transport system component
MFFDYLLQKHGEDRLAAFAQAVAGQWVPYRLDAAGKDAFGASISEEWRNWTEELSERYADLDAELSAAGPVTRGVRLTPRSRFALYPRVSRDGSTLAYASADGRSDAQVRTSALDGSGQRQLTRTSSLPTFDWLPDGSLLFSHLDFAGPYRTFGDLVVQGADGGQQRVTKGARLVQPSAGPDGTWAVAVQEGDGTNGLVRVDLSSGAVTVLVTPRADVHWAHPAVSPDGAWIAVSRWTPGAYTDVVLLDARGNEVMALTQDRAMDLAPTWSPDGETVLWTSDRTGILNVVAADVDPSAGFAGPVRMVTNVSTGVAYPAVSPDGTWLFVSAYHADGWEVERVPYRPDTWLEAPPLDARFEVVGGMPTAGAGPQPPGPDPVAGDPQGYSPLHTLWPRYWEPLYKEPVNTGVVQTEELFLRSRRILGPSVGAQTSGRDLVGRHAYSAWARFFTESDGQTDGGFSYSYAGLGTPVLGLSADQRWGDDGVRIAQAEDGAPLDTLFVLERERSLSLSSSFHRRTWRSTLALSVSGGLSWEQRELLDNALEPATAYRLTQTESKLSDFRVTLSYGTARGHALQMGPSEGYSLWVRGRVRRDLTVADSLTGRPGIDRSVDEVLGLARGYINLGGPGHAAHVIALRVSGGYADGPNAHAGFLDVGGASGTSEDITGLDLFGGSSVFLPVRGYRTSYRTGRAAWSATAEYRAPLAMLNRGLGAWPLHVDRVVGSVFVDAGNAWGPELDLQGYYSPRRATLVSVGAELTTEVLTFWNITSRVRLGVAQPMVEGNGTVAYLRLGLPF